MNTFFSYIYYRFAKAYFKWDGRRAVTAVFGVTGIQMFWLMDFIFLISKFFPPQSWVQENKQLIKWSFLGLTFLLLFVNYRIHDGKYNQYKKRWISEQIMQSRIRGLCVVILIVLPLILMPIIINSTIKF